MFVDEAQIAVKTDSELVATLKAAKALIVDPKNWIKGKYASSVDDCEVSPLAKDAVKFCMVGALAKASGLFSCSYPGDRLHEQRLLAPFHKSVDGAIPFFNDHPFRQHHEVMAAFDAAIVEAEKL